MCRGGDALCVSLLSGERYKKAIRHVIFFKYLCVRFYLEGGGVLYVSLDGGLG